MPTATVPNLADNKLELEFGIGKVNEEKQPPLRPLRMAIAWLNCGACACAAVSDLGWCAALSEISRNAQAAHHPLRLCVCVCNCLLIDCLDIAVLLLFVTANAPPLRTHECARGQSCLGVALLLAVLVVVVAAVSTAVAVFTIEGSFSLFNP